MKEYGFFCYSDSTEIDQARSTSYKSGKVTYAILKQQWLDEDVNHTVVEQDMEDSFSSCDCYYNDNGTIAFNEAEYVGIKQAELKNKLAEYRWNITHIGVDGGYPISYMNGFPIFHTDDARTRLLFSVDTINKKLNSGALQPTDTERFKTVSGTWTDVVVGDVIDWPEMLVNSEQIFFDKEEVVEEDIDTLTTKTEVDAFNVGTELDTLVKPILAADLTSYAYPIKYHNEDL